jgi:AcrR family transcriptional regulator
VPINTQSGKTGSRRAANNSHGAGKSKSFRRAKKVEPGGERLGEQQIVDAAVRVARQSGFEGLTMRALGDELGVTPMAAYYHVPSKQALMELVVDRVLSGLEFPPKSAGSWDERIRTLLTQQKQVMASYPGITTVVPDINAVPHGLRLMNQTVEILCEAGFDEGTAILACQVLHTYWYGSMCIQLERVDRLRKQMADVQYLDFGLDTIFRGLQAQLREISASKRRR